MQRTRAGLEDFWNRTPPVLRDGELIYVQTRWEVVTDLAPAHHVMTIVPPSELDRNDQTSAVMRSDATANTAVHELFGHAQGLPDRYVNDDRRARDVFRDANLRLHATNSTTVGDRPKTRPPLFLDQGPTLMARHLARA